jgi:hypothetical protein
LGKKVIITKVKAMAHFKIDSETESKVEFQKKKGNNVKLRQNYRITEMLITSHCISAEKKRM